MLLREKMENSMKILHDRSKDLQDQRKKPEWEEEKTHLERGDLFAMLLSALFTILIPVTLVILALVGISYFVLLR